MECRVVTQTSTMQKFALMTSVLHTVTSGSPVILFSSVHVTEKKVREGDTDTLYNVFRLISEILNRQTDMHHRELPIIYNSKYVTLRGVLVTWQTGRLLIPPNYSRRYTMESD